MTYRGISKGKTIELDESLPFADGQAVRVSVEPVAEAPPLGSGPRILEAMRNAPHVSAEDVDELERLIKEGQMPIRYKGIFDDESE